MKVKVNISALGQSEWHEYIIRFAFGGAVTGLAGIIATKYGPGMGGLFLAFPAIFPASATLIAKHEEQNKQRAGKSGIIRARTAAGADAAGAAMGSIGLIAFAVIVWQWIPFHDAVPVLCLATLGWFTSAFLTWLARETPGRSLRELYRRLGHKP